jgi:hypothetical protein
MRFGLSKHSRNLAIELHLLCYLLLQQLLFLAYEHLNNFHKAALLSHYFFKIVLLLQLFLEDALGLQRILASPH